MNINLINEGITEIKHTFIIHLILINENKIEGKEEFISIKTNETTKKIILISDEKDKENANPDNIYVMRNKNKAFNVE